MPALEFKSQIYDEVNKVRKVILVFSKKKNHVTQKKG